MIKIITISFFLLSSNLLGAGTTSETSDDADTSNEIKTLYERAEQYIDDENYNKSLKVLKNLTKREDLNGFRADIYNLLGFSYRKIDILN